MSRFKLFIVWMAFTVIVPLMLIAMLIQAVLGSAERAYKMALAIDECGNALFGGEPQQTISRRTGLALLAGKAWAIPASKFIDFIFYKGHCLDAAQGPAPVGDTPGDFPQSK